MGSSISDDSHLNSIRSYSPGERTSTSGSEEGTRKSSYRRDLRGWIAVWVGLAIVTVLAIHRLRDFPYHLSFRDAWLGADQVLHTTLWAAVRVWIFWAWSAAVLAGCALKIDSELELSDALLIGAGGLWVLAYLLGNLLGPIGEFNTPTIWSLLVLGTVWLWMHPPKVRFARMTTGQMLTLLAVGLLAVSMIPLQLASPLPPFMDVLSYPSSAQRILTFHTYLPFDNDPYGCWGPYAQTPALELFYAMLAIGSHLQLATLAVTGAMMPMVALLLFAAYRLGKTLYSDTAGGMAALLMFSTCLFRRAQGMRGTAVDFALVGLGLAFFFNRERRRLLIAIGAAMLGTAVASHAIDGGFATIIAGSGILFWFVDGDFERVETAILTLAGAAMVATPEFAIGLARPLTYPILPAFQLTGLVLIALGISRLHHVNDRSGRSHRALGRFNLAVIAFFIFAVLFRDAVERYSIYAQIAGNLPLLTLFCFGGLVVAIAIICNEGVDAMPYAGVAALALLLAVVYEYAGPMMASFTHSPSTSEMVSDLGIKLWDYWCPYFLMLPAGFLFAIAYERWSKQATLFVLLTLLIYPWYQSKNPVDYDSLEHSITELWAFNLQTAAVGYWSGHADRRWTFGDAEWPLIKVLNNEITAGRITLNTHILHLTDSISSWSLVQFSVLTGVNDDPLEYRHDPNNLWEGGSRVRGLGDLPAALATRPPYILEQAPRPPTLADPPAGYDLILTSGYLRLYRRHGLAGALQHSAGGRADGYRYIVAIGALLGIVVVILRRRYTDVDRARKRGHSPLTAGGVLSSEGTTALSPNYQQGAISNAKVGPGV